MTKEETIQLDYQICFPLYVASRMITRAYQPLLDEMGITYPQYLVLMVLWEKDGVTVNEIAHKLYLNTNTITPLLKRMEKAEIITRTRSAEDERKVLITLSPKGDKLRESAYCIPEEIFKKMSLPVSEVQQMKEMLSKLIDQMEK